MHDEALGNPMRQDARQLGIERQCGLMIVWCATAAVSILMCAEAAVGQDQGLNAPAVSEQRQADVYIDDSFEAVDAIAEAKQLARRNDWTEAARILQNVSIRAGEKLYPVSDGAYVSIVLHISDLISNWPRDGIRAYRALYDRDLEAIREAHPSVPANQQRLLVAFERYFCTTGAAPLADELAQLALEAGDFTLARRLYARVLEDHPDAARFRETVRAKLAIMSAIEGKNAEADWEGERLALDFLGQRVALDEALRIVEERFDSVNEESVVQDWPTYAGNVSRSQTTASQVQQLGLLWRYRGAEGDSDRAMDRSVDPFWFENSERRSASINPVISDGVLYMQRKRELAAIDLKDGGLRWRVGAEDGGSSSEWESNAVSWHGLTVARNRMYTVFSERGGSYYGYEGRVDSSDLVCIDTRNGDSIWRLNHTSLGLEDDKVAFDPAPLVHQDRLYVVARRRRSFGFEDCYLLGLSARSGQLLFKTHLGSASTGTYGSQQLTTTVPALFGDTVYICTNLGTVVAVSAQTGLVRWLRFYERGATGDPSMGFVFQPTASWMLNPTIHTDSKIICMPTDTQRVLVFDAENGELVRSVNRDRLESPHSLLGVSGDHLFVAGSRLVCYDIGEDELVWRSSMPAGEELTGRGALTTDRLLVPTEKHLLSFDAKTGTRTALPWDAEGRGGNVVALNDMLIVASDRTVSAYVALEQIWAQLRKAMEAAPSDPVPALKMAEMALNSLRFEDGLEALQEAVRRAGGLVAPLDSDLRTRFYEDAMRFVSTMSRRDQLAVEKLDALYAIASQAAPTPSEHLAYRLRFADLYVTMGRVEFGVGILQQILRDRSLSNRPVSETLSGSMDAGRYAKERIDEMIDQHGRAVFGRFENEAASLFIQAKQSRDRGLLARVWETYPNSLAATDALIVLAKIFSESGQHEDAARRLTAAYHTRLGSPDAPQLMRRIADEYEAAGLTKYAYRWLTKAVREHPQATVLVDGRPVPLTEYRSRLANIRSLIEPSRPAVILPLDNSAVVESVEGATLLVPWFGDDPTMDWGKVYLFKDDRILAYDSRLREMLWERGNVHKGRAELLIATREMAVFTTLYEVFALDARDGQPLWTVGSYPESMDDELADWERSNPYRLHTVNGSKLASVRGGGEAACVDLASGKLLWEKRYSDGPAGHLHLSDLFVAFYIVADSRIELIVLSTATGEEIARIPTDETPPINDLVVTLDDQIILVTSQSVVAYDIDTGGRRWRTLLDGMVRSAASLVDIDTMYLSSDGLTVRKLSLSDGRQLWQSNRVTPASDLGLTLSLESGAVIASTERSVAALDKVSGNVLWEGTTPRSPRFLRRVVTDAYVAAIHIPASANVDDSAVLFYDHREASGVVPREGGMRKLPGATERAVQAILFADDALIIQIDNELHCWTHTSNE